MEIQNQADADIVQIAEEMYTEIVAGSNAKDWERFSQFFDKKTQKEKSSVLEQWENNPALTSLTEKRELLGILRRDDHVLVIWKQWSTEVKGEHLAMLYLQTVDATVKSIGIFLH